MTTTLSKNIDIGDLWSVLVDIDGPLDEDVYRTAKFKHEQYKELLEKLYKQESKYDFSDTDKQIVMDALRMFLEGICDGDVTAVTGKNKEHFLNLFGELIKEWNMSMPKLKRQSYDIPEYQEKATASGLVEELI